MVTLKLKKNRLGRYRSAVTKGLKDTDLNAELVTKFEKLIYDQAQLEAERLKCLDQIDQCKHLYLSIARHLISNLKAGNYINNQKFIKHVNNGDIAPEEAVKMSPQEMHPDRWRVLLERKQADLDKLTKDPEATTDTFKCGRCRRNKCTYFERQDRSSDEPMTRHITCCYCGNYWKQ
jgi:DNA-directed RNA polymerase subunit M/transcription elongation factor TFIIS